MFKLFKKEDLDKIKAKVKDDQRVTRNTALCDIYLDRLEEGEKADPRLFDLGNVGKNNAALYQQFLDEQED